MNAPLQIQRRLPLYSTKVTLFWSRGGRHMPSNPNVGFGTGLFGTQEQMCLRFNPLITIILFLSTF